MPTTAASQSPVKSTAHAQPLEARVAEVLARMTLEEKAALLAGDTHWSIPGVPRLGVPGVNVVDGPHGANAREAAGTRGGGPATAFPCGAGMAASWDPDLLREIAAAMGRETRARNCGVLLAPCINLVRNPHGGRNFETYGEDPLLTAALGVAFVEGLQAEGVGASLKHFACNNHEAHRHRIDVVVGERALRELYLPHFEAVVQRARPWTVMNSYNQLNGIHTSASVTLLDTILRQEWAYEGAVLSDWAAVHDFDAALEAGCDVEMPGMPRWRGVERICDAVYQRRLDPRIVDRSAARVLRLLLRAQDGARTIAPDASVGSLRHRDLARRAAIAGVVMLRNQRIGVEGAATASGVAARAILPIAPSEIRRLAIIGPLADVQPAGGGSSGVWPERAETLVAALTRAYPTATIERAIGCTALDRPAALPGAWLRGGAENGRVLAQFWKGTVIDGEPRLTRGDAAIESWWWTEDGPEPLGSGPFVARWTGEVVPPVDGPFELVVGSYGGAIRARAGSSAASTIEASSPGSAEFLHIDDVHQADPRGLLRLRVDGGPARPIAFTIEFTRDPSRGSGGVALMHMPAESLAADRFADEAVAIASRCDAVIYAGGLPPEWESEGFDRPHLRLPGGQDALIGRLAQANSRFAAIIYAGAPVLMPWAATVPAILFTPYPGQEGPAALADIISGAVEPGGRLPFTLPLRAEDAPSHTDDPQGRQVLYGEGIFIGYRWYDRRQLDVAFPFGHGLGYAEPAFEAITANANDDGTATVLVTVANRGRRAGAAVVQCYLEAPPCPVPRAPQQLAAFARVQLEAGERTAVEVRIAQRAFERWDEVAHAWVRDQGPWMVRAGASARSEGVGCRVGYEAQSIKHKA